MFQAPVTSGTTTHELEAPFLVMATQNPIESEGPYKGTVRLEAIELAEDVIRAELPEPVIGPGESEHG